MKKLIFVLLLLICVPCYADISLEPLMNTMRESETHALKTIDYAHHETHGGSGFFAIDSTDISANGRRDLLIVTPNTTKWAHMIWTVEWEKESTLFVSEDVTASSNGTAVSVGNRDRNSTTSATVSVYHTPTVSNGGTKLYEIREGDGKKLGGDDRAIEEIILKQNSKYWITVKEESGANNLTVIKLSWYEHTNK